jgi:hypothetical protein
MMRRAQAKTPPKPDSDIAAKAENSSAMLGCGGTAAVGAKQKAKRNDEATYFISL